MTLTLFNVIKWMIIPTAHFILWLYVAYKNHLSLCSDFDVNDVDNTLNNVESSSNVGKDNCIKQKLNECSHYLDENHYISVEFVNSDVMETYRSEMADMQYPAYTTLLKSFDATKNIDSIKDRTDDRCDQIRHHYTARDSNACLSIFFSNINNNQSINYRYSIMRYDPDINEEGRDKKDPQAVKYKAPGDTYHFVPNKHNTKDKLRPIGFFRKVPKMKGRVRLHDKLKPFLEYFDEINKQLEDKLKTSGVEAGGDIIVMVVNEGEIDLFLNFACSCQQHNIQLNNLIVFSGSVEIINIIESTGAMALYHVGYGVVSKKASMDYLDRTFVDMMWYKAFSVYIVLRLGYNILFQDVDLVWFRQPLPYFHSYATPITGATIEAFFSDDGQRSLRYAPLYGNSGFYYMISSERSIYFTWSIMTAFDSVQLLGSHQNVFTTRLIEGLGLGCMHTKILPMNDFPTGFLFHHNRHYMNQLKRKEVNPYHFHMCWTQGKVDKLENLRKALMWYLTDTCSPIEQYVGPNGRVYREVTPVEDNIITSFLFSKQKLRNIIEGNKNEEANELDINNKWRKLSNLCCMSMDGAP